MIWFVKIVASAAMLLAALSIPARAEDGQFATKGAANIARWFTGPRYEAAASGIQWPLHKESRGAGDESTPKALRHAGFDTAHFAVDPAPFIVFDKRRDALR